MLAMLACRNLRPTQAKRWLTVRGQRELQTLGLNRGADTIREDCRALLSVLDEQIRRLDTTLAKQSLTTIGSGITKASAMN